MKANAAWDKRTASAFIRACPLPVLFEVNCCKPYSRPTKRGKTRLLCYYGPIGLADSEAFWLRSLLVGTVGEGARLQLRHRLIGEIDM
jgi:hypothetical protein